MARSSFERSIDRLSQPIQQGDGTPRAGIPVNLAGKEASWWSSRDRRVAVDEMRTGT